MATKERVNPVILRDSEDGKVYTLEFDRETVLWAEQTRDFSVQDLSRLPMSKIYEFFWLSFRMHHKNVAKEKTDKIIDSWGGIRHLPDGLMERLGELWAQAYDMGDANPQRVTVEL